jgi:RNA polymerase primary sigma factor
MAAASVLAPGVQPAQDTASAAAALADGAPRAALSLDVEDILATLAPRERRVLQLRFGFVDFRERTVEEVGRRMGVPCERVTSIEKEALAKFERLVAGR